VPRPVTGKRSSFLRPFEAAGLLAWAYLAGLALWFAVSRAHGDTPGYFGVATSLALYFFAPLPLVLLLAAARRRRALLVAALAGVALFGALWGRLFLPRTPGAFAEASTLRVMTFNGLGTNEDLAAFVEAIRAENADVVLLQELSPGQARALETELGDRYPHRILDPRVGVRGMGAVSRYPVHRLPDAFRSEWGCENQTLLVDFDGRRVHLVNFHLLPYPDDLLHAAALTRSFTRREREAAELAAWVRSLPEGTPVILAGDANASTTNRAWRLLTRDLDDAWLEAGSGLGHTFPDQEAEGRSVVRRLGFEPPSWLVRIDYVLYSPRWRAVRARTAASAGGSDHRGVIAELALADRS